MHAEQAYLFRHALLRDAAYQLQLPGDRSRLHRLAFELIEALIPDAMRDSYAEELAAHAGAAAELQPEYRRFQQRYTLRAAKYARGRNDILPAIQFYERVVTGAVEPDLVAEACCEVADLYRIRGDMAACIAAAQRAAQAAESATDPVLRGRGIGVLGAMYWQTGRMAEAQGHLRRAASMFKESGHDAWRARTLAYLANVLEEQHQEEAMEIRREALELAKVSSDLVREAFIEGDMASQAIRQGQYDVADSHLARCLNLNRAIADERQLGESLGNLAVLRARQGRFEEAEAAYRDALAINRRIGNRRSEGIALANMGDLILSSGRQAEALQVYIEAIALNREIMNRRAESVALVGKGNVLLDLGRFQSALSSYRAALVARREIGYWSGAAMAAYAMARVLHYLGCSAEVASSLRECEAMSDRAQTRVLMDVWVASIREAEALDSGNLEEARRQLALAERSLALRNTPDREVEVQHMRAAALTAESANPILVRGRSPSTLEPAARLALVAILKNEGKWEAQRSKNAEFEAAMLAGTEGLSTPKWDDPEPA